MEQKLRTPVLKNKGKLYIKSHIHIITNSELTLSKFKMLHSFISPLKQINTKFFFISKIVHQQLQSAKSVEV